MHKKKVHVYWICYTTAYRKVARSHVQTMFPTMPAHEWFRRKLNLFHVCIMNDSLKKTEVLPPAQRGWCIVNSIVPVYIYYHQWRIDSFVTYWHHKAIYTCFHINLKVSNQWTRSKCISPITEKWYCPRTVGGFHKTEVGPPVHELWLNIDWNEVGAPFECFNKYETCLEMITYFVTFSYTE